MGKAENESQLAVKEKENALLLTKTLLEFIESNLTKIRRLTPANPTVSNEAAMIQDMSSEFVFETLIRAGGLIPPEVLNETATIKKSNFRSDSSDSAIEIIDEDENEQDELHNLIKKLRIVSSNEPENFPPSAPAPDSEEAEYDILITRFENLNKQNKPPQNLTWQNISVNYPQVFDALLNQLNDLVKSRDPGLQEVQDPFLKWAEYQCENIVTQFYDHKISKSSAIKQLVDIFKELESHKTFLEKQLEKVQSPTQNPPAVKIVSPQWKSALQHPFRTIQNLIGHHPSESKKIGTPKK